MNAKTAIDDAEFRTLAERCALAYRASGRFQHGYVRGKLLHDPVYRQLTELGPLAGPVCDLGCGRGQTELLLGALQPGLQVHAFDWDEHKLQLARTAAWRAGMDDVRFHAGDLRCLDVPTSGTILMLDVLHYNPIEIQDAMLVRAARALLPGGRLILREVNFDGSLRARLNALQERFGCLLLLNRGARLCFRSADSIEARLRAEGLATRRLASWRGTPLANVLIEAQATSV